jgi:hypothetical protein
MISRRAGIKQDRTNFDKTAAEINGAYLSLSINAAVLSLLKNTFDVRIGRRMIVAENY